MVIFVLTYYLPQHQHPAPGVLAIRSLALLGHLKADQQIQSDERSSDSWQLYQVQPRPQAGLLLQPRSPSRLLYCTLQRGTEGSTPRIVPSKRKGKRRLQL